MVYYTFSQGFRPGGFNQNGGSTHAFTPTDPRAAVLHPELLLIRQADEQRDRLEDRVLRPSPAMERRHLPRELGRRAGRLLRSGRGGQHFLQHQRPELPRQGPGDLLSRAGHAADSPCRPQASWNKAGRRTRRSCSNNNPASPGLRQADHGRLQLLRRQLRAGAQSVRPDRFAERERTADCSSACAPATSGPSADYHPFVQAGATHQRSFVYPGGANPTIGSGCHQHRPPAI